MTVAPKEQKDERTRQKVLAAVLDHGPVSASEVARQMGLTAAAIRRHLDALEEEGFVEVRQLAGVRPGRGRPARHYVLTLARLLEVHEVECGTPAVEHLDGYGPLSDIG